MKTLQLLIIKCLLIKSIILCASILSNKSLIEEATKCLFRTSLRSTHSTRMCFAVRLLAEEIDLKVTALDMHKIVNF